MATENSNPTEDTAEAEPRLNYVLVGHSWGPLSDPHGVNEWWCPPHSSRATNQSRNLPRRTSHQGNRSSQQPVSGTSRSRQHTNNYSPSEMRSTQYQYSRDQLSSITSGSNVESLYPNLGNDADQRNERQNSNIHRSATSRTFSPMSCARPRAASTSRMYNSTPGAASRNSSSRRPEPTPRGTLTEQHCPTCNKIFGETIYQCKNGHSACDRCRSGGIRCGLCRGEVLSMRNYPVEEHLREWKVSCPNKEYGCVICLRRADMWVHLLECIFREMDCPLAAIETCAWRGKRSVDMVRHFDECHPQARRVGVGEEGLLQRPCSDARQVHLVILNCYFFLVHVKTSEANETFSMAVQLLGPKTGASKWMFEVNLYNKAEPRRKLTYHDACTPDGDPIDDIFKEHRCLVLPLAYIRSLANEHGLTYKFFITKTGEDESERPQRTRQRNNRPWSQTRIKRNVNLRETDGDE